IIEQNIVDYQGNIIEGVQAFDVDMKTEINKKETERQLPVFIAKLDNGTTKHIFPLHGKGLWGPIWGYVALNDDMNTIYGCVFAHKGETPGLGAEIDTKDFQNKFNGKQIFNSNNELVSIKLTKEGQNVIPEHSVDAISGGTITSRGLEEMIEDCLKMYLNYFKKVNE
ncbi:MAG: NADH:ubiquinone reductase (Na(+)-transporting) subunit C, partial [Bacteroidales bacterium]|nr:NADH:ubiquinone reductase (Na(+)-transporting) subunit C [Bacteroidales bacterium]